MTTQGQSDSTEYKERGFGHVLRFNLGIFRDHVLPRIPRACYWHFDLHAGNGHNDLVDVVGSPIVFLSEVIRTDVPFQAHFVELNPNRAATLSDRLGPSQHCMVHRQDNRVFLQSLPDLLREGGENPAMAIGSILVDPNCPSDIPTTQLVEVLRKCPRMDVILNIPTGHMKRINGAAASPKIRAEKMLAKLLLPVDIPGIFPRKHWLVRVPIENRNGFALFIGRNFEAGAWVKQWFYSTRSQKGKELLECLSYPGRKFYAEPQLSIW